MSLDQNKVAEFVSLYHDAKFTVAVTEDSGTYDVVSHWLDSVAEPLARKLRKEGYLV